MVAPNPAPPGWEKVAGPKGLAASVRAERARRDLTQSETAEQIGVTKQTIWRWERGITTPRGEELERLIDWLGEEA